MKWEYDPSSQDIVYDQEGLQSVTFSAGPLVGVSDPVQWEPDVGHDYGDVSPSFPDMIRTHASWQRG